ncbi:hypothetical protein ACJIZ3_024330 [Penstemon smallii]|uniref:Uncharacterized protein n=1 Tax=Penstemon smallii TaxID=265156 RepID=A0ABD3TRI2_9LAMI
MKFLCKFRNNIKEYRAYYPFFDIYIKRRSFEC